MEPTAAARKIAGVLLAAGMSSRMGQNKLFLSLGGRTLLERAVATALEAGLDPLVVVVGHEADRVRAALAGIPASLAENPDHARGQNTSIAVGISALPPGVDAAVVMLADMPRVDAAMIGGLVAAFAMAARRWWSPATATSSRRRSSTARRCSASCARWTASGAARPSSAGTAARRSSSAGRPIV